MSLKKNIFYKTAVMSAWSTCAFFLSISSLSTVFYYKLAFRKIYIPVAYWLWVIVGLGILKYVYKEKKEGLKIFVLASILFNLSGLMSQLLVNKSLLTYLAGPYLLYICVYIYSYTLLLSLWATDVLLTRNSNTFLPRLPLTEMPFFCIFHSIYKMNAIGIWVFGLAIVSLFTLLFAVRFFKTVFRYLILILKYISGNKVLPMALIFLIAFLARISFSTILVAKTGNDYLLASDDGMTYDEIARSIIQNPQNMVKILAGQPWPPLYMVFLSILYGLFGRNFYIVAILQSAIGAGVAVVVYLLGKKMFNENTGIIAGILTAMSQPLIFTSAVLGTEALYIPLVILAVYFFVDATFFARKRREIKIILSGVGFALAAMTLGSITLFPLLIALFIPLIRNLGDSTFKNIKISAIFIASFLALFLIMKSVYIIESGSYKSVYETEGTALWQAGSSYNYGADPDNRKFIELGINPFNNPLGALRIAWFNWKKVMLIAFEVFPVRIRNFFLWDNFGFFDPVFLVNPGRVPNTFSPTLQFYALIFFFIGLLLAIKNGKRSGISLILLLVFYYVFIHAIVFPCHSVRYGCPVKPFLIVFLAYGLNRGCQYLLERS